MDYFIQPAVDKLPNNRTSLRRNRLAPRQQLPQTVVLQTPPPHKLDVWLPRLANFTQVALLLLTAGGFYFTVLPLYQKALLDESFARKEIELKQVSASVEAQYAKLRGVAVRGFIVNADTECSGIGELLRIKESRQLTRAQIHEQAFTSNVKKCLLDYEAKSSGLSELRTDDRAFFRTAVAKAAERIAGHQSNFAAIYKRANEDINDSNMDMYAEKRKFSSEMLKIITQLVKYTPEEIAARKRLAAVQELQEQRISAYWSASRVELQSLARLNWPRP